MKSLRFALGVSILLVTVFLVRNCQWFRSSNRSYSEHSGAIGLRAAVELYMLEHDGLYPPADWSEILGEDRGHYPKDFLEKIVYNDVAEGKKAPQDKETPLLIVADFSRTQLFRVLYFDYDLDGEDFTSKGLLKLKPKFSTDSWVRVEELIKKHGAVESQ